MGKGKHSAYNRIDTSFGENTESKFGFRRKKREYEEIEDDEIDVPNLKPQTDDEINYVDNDDDENDWKNKVIIIGIIILLIMLICMIYKIWNENKDNVVDSEVQTEQSELPQTYEGFPVLGKIIIKKINVEQYIFNSVSEEALKKGVGKLYGPMLNSLGNFCIAGHNYNNIFENLKDLKVNDEIVIQDKKLNETIYEVKEVFTVEPSDLKCLLQNEEKQEITLITCVNGATSRLIVKAEKKSH